MMTLLTSRQTRAADQFTIAAKGISSVDLMESAAAAFVSVFKAHYLFRDVSISIYCGTGNNGGDGLAIARLLKEQGYDRVSVKIARFSRTLSEEFDLNLQRLELTGISIENLHTGEQFRPEDAEIIIDALLGSGLSRPLEGDFEMLVQSINAAGKTIVSVDVPTGFPAEGVINTPLTTVKADLVISFQRPKINFFFPESASCIKRFRFVDIGLDEPFIQSQPGGWKLLEPDDIRKVIKPRAAFSHKGTYGHALIVAGSRETMGAAILCADACLHGGAGLTTACIPAEGLSALNSSNPEVMALIRYEQKELKADLQKYQAIAIGPGLGTEEPQVGLLSHILTNCLSPLVLDADALNILSTHPDLMSQLPRRAILTPHVKEFDRLFGDHENWWERIVTGRRMSAQHEVIIVLKNEYTFVILPDNRVIINPTGNPAMATGGMGDVLTGLIAAFLAQGYLPEEAAIAGCYFHGKTGDILKEKGGMHCIPPRYIIKKLPEVIGSYSDS